MQALRPTPAEGKNSRKWTGTDTRWGFTLFGTAVGAGILYLPISMAAGGVWALMFLTLIILPMTYLPHRALCRIILAADRADGNITDAVEDHFGKGAGFAITLVYFLTLYSICLIYSVGITNEFNSFISNVLKLNAPPRWLLSFILIAAMTGVVMFGTRLMTRVTSALVLPLIILLFGFSLMGIPFWKTTVFHSPPDPGRIASSILVGIPVLVFAMGFWPVMSTFAVSYRRRFHGGPVLDRKTGRVVWYNSVALFFFILFFVYSVMLGLKPERLEQALSENLSAMSAITRVEGMTFIPAVASLIAITAIMSSYFGTLSGSREGFNGIVVKWFRRRDKNRHVNVTAIDRFCMVFHAVSMWGVAVLDLTILDLISAFTAPFIAMILYLMPVYAIRRIPKLAAYRTPVNGLVFLMGIVVLCGYGISLFL